MTYCLDTNTLIDAGHLWYTPRTHPTLWDAIVALAATGKVKVPLQVYEELGQQKDELFDWCKAHQDTLIFEPTEKSETQYKLLANKYPELTGSLGLRQNYADLYVVAVAMVTRGTVVTTEDVGFKSERSRQTRARKNYKITNVCFDEGVEVIRIYEVLRRQGWVFTHGE